MELNDNASSDTGNDMGSNGSNGTNGNYTTPSAFTTEQLENMARAMVVSISNAAIAVNEESKKQTPAPVLSAASRWKPIADLYGEIAPTEWIIDNVIPEESCVLMYGESGTGKSFLAVHWAMQAAHAGRVVAYHAAEGRKSIAKRFYAAGSVVGFPSPDKLFLDSHPINLLDKKNENVPDIITSLLAMPTKPDMLILDTLATATSGYNDNDSEQTGIVLESIRRIRDTIKCSVLVVHHKPKDARATPRGSGRLRDDNDVCIDVAHYGDTSSRELVVTCAKMKDDDLFKTHYYRREVTTVATVANRAGVAIDVTSCYLQPITLEETPLNPKSDPLKPRWREAYNLILSYGKVGCGVKNIAAALDISEINARGLASKLIALEMVENVSESKDAIYRAIGI